MSLELMPLSVHAVFLIGFCLSFQSDTQKNPYFYSLLDSLKSSFRLSLVSAITQIITAL